MTVLEARSIRKLYGDVCALDGVSFAVRDGEFVSIVGPNGAGKTTLVNVLAGRLAPTSGSVLFKGRDVARLGPVRLARLGMARSFQLAGVFPGLTVAETLAVAAVSRGGQGGRALRSLAGLATVQSEVADVAAAFNLTRALDRPARTLAHGDQKLLDVASAVALRPEVVVLDEPTSGVSTRDKTAIMEVLVHAARRVGIKAIVCVEHDMDIVFGYSDRVVALCEGRVLADTTPAGLLADEPAAAIVLGRYGPHAGS